MNAKKLPPPRGAAQTRSAAEGLNRRWTQPAEPENTDAGEDETTPPAPAKPRRRPPPDRTRRTLYLSTDTATELDAAIARVHAACSGIAPRHEVIAALIRHGLNAEATATADVLQRLRDRLTSTDTEQTQDD